MDGKDIIDKQYKIKYCVNFLPACTKQDQSIIQAISKSEELEIFESDIVKELIEFKWNSFAYEQHKRNLYMHLLYVASLLYYVKDVYLKPQVYDAQGNHKCPSANKVNLGVNAFFLMYAVKYYGIQFYKQGLAYFSSVGNIVDIMHICFGILNIWL